MLGSEYRGSPSELISPKVTQILRLNPASDLFGTNIKGYLYNPFRTGLFWILIRRFWSKYKIWVTSEDPDSLYLGLWGHAVEPTYYISTFSYTWFIAYNLYFQCSVSFVSLSSFEPSDYWTTFMTNYSTNKTLIILVKIFCGKDFIFTEI